MRPSTVTSALDAAAIAPMVTWGTSPEDALSITGRIPEPSTAPDAAKQDSMKRALDYMGLVSGTPLEEVAVDRVFIGSCTNSRIEDLRAAAVVAKGRKVVIPSWVVAGSGLVKKQAEAEGLDKIFREAGFEWREPGCSMCVGMNGDTGLPGAAHRLDLEPQLHRPPGPRRAHPPAQPGDGRRRRP